MCVSLYASNDRLEGCGREGNALPEKREHGGKRKALTSRPTDLYHQIKSNRRGRESDFRRRFWGFGQREGSVLHDRYPLRSMKENTHTQQQTYSTFAYLRELEGKEIVCRSLVDTGTLIHFISQSVQREGLIDSFQFPT